MTDEAGDGNEAPSTGCWYVLSRLPTGQGLEGTGKGPSSSVKGRRNISASPSTPQDTELGQVLRRWTAGVGGRLPCWQNEAKGTAERHRPPPRSTPQRCAASPTLQAPSHAGPSAWIPLVLGPPSWPAENSTNPKERVLPPLLQGPVQWMHQTLSQGTFPDAPPYTHITSVRPTGPTVSRGGRVVVPGA